MQGGKRGAEEPAPQLWPAGRGVYSLTRSGLLETDTERLCDFVDLIHDRVRV